MSRVTRSTDRGNYLFLVGVTVGLLLGVLVDRYFESEEWRLFQAVRNLVSETYVEEVEADELFLHSLEGMIGGLDRHSRLYVPEEVTRLDRETSGEFRGIGVVFRPPASEMRILFSYPDSPAARAGIGTGDQIVAANGREIASFEANELQNALQRGETGTLELVVADRHGTRREVSVIPEQVIDPSVRHAEVLDEEHKVGYLTILSFSNRTAGEFDEVMAHFEERGVERLIIDLRGNPGGILEAGVAIANRFVAEGPLVVTETRNGTRTDRADSSKARYVGMPVVLLVDENTASASEVLAGCLQDYGAAVIVGEETYGKGTVQTLSRIEKENLVIKLTTARYFTPLLRQLEREGEHRGLAPDIVFESTTRQRAEIYRHLARYSIPPSARPAIEELEAELEEELLPEAPDDPLLDFALDLLTDSLAKRVEARD